MMSISFTSGGVHRGQLDAAEAAFEVGPAKPRVALHGRNSSSSAVEPCRRSTSIYKSAASRTRRYGVCCSCRPVITAALEMKGSTGGSVFASCYR